jgi:hypothetical protein
MKIRRAGDAAGAMAPSPRAMVIEKKKVFRSGGRGGVGHKG